MWGKKNLDVKPVTYVWKPEDRHRKSFDKCFRHQNQETQQSPGPVRIKTLGVH